MSMPFGRPSFKCEIDFKSPLDYTEKILYMCKNEDIRHNVVKFAKTLLSDLEKEEKSCQTENCPRSLLKYVLDNNSKENVIGSISEISNSLASYEQSYLIHQLMIQMDETFQVKLLLWCYTGLSLDGQSDFLALVGSTLNESLLDSAKKSEVFCKDLNLEHLKKASKEEFYQSCDLRLKSFIDHITVRSRSSSDNENFKSNVYENLLKARHSKFFSHVGVKEHLVVYLASGKSRYASQIFAKQGGKGTRPVLENILNNSVSICKFVEPKNFSLFFSFDNIQKLLKSHKVGGENQKKVLAIVVCSILCLKSDGQKQSDVQYRNENCPSYWLYDYKYNAETLLFNKCLDSAVLKNCVNLTEREVEMFEDIFEKELHQALDYVKQDMNENMQDSIDIQSKVAITKKRKLCSNGHINDNVKKNRKICDRETCKAQLNMDPNPIEQIVIPHKEEEAKDVSTQKANMYMNVENISNGNSPEQLAVGAFPVNPNTPERICKVLDTIIEAAGMKNQFSVKIIFSEQNVKKVFLQDDTLRKHIVVTADGLPYKIMISLIENTHDCASCGKRLNQIGDLNDHIKETQHSEYFQTYGVIIPNIGYFHYGLTMLRSIVKLTWNIDYEELCKSIRFETPKALFMQENVTDFRKCLDTFRTARQAKLRELVTPYVKYCLENNMPVEVKGYLVWKKFFVKSSIYKTVYDIEKYYSTSFLLFHSALRANNFELIKIAKKMFSPLFHINRHPNYSIMDIHTDYVEQNLADKAPDLASYLSTRRCSNLTGKPYSSEPHDERHEEYNKRGINMQNVRTVEDFQQSFQLVDHYISMRDTIFEDYDIKMHGGNDISLINYEENIAKMRIAMRQHSYL